MLEDRGVEPLPLLRDLVGRYLKRYHDSASSLVGATASKALFELDALLELQGLEETLWEESSRPPSSSRFILLWHICASTLERHSRVFLEQVYGDKNMLSQVEDNEEEEYEGGRAARSSGAEATPLNAPIVNSEPLTVSFHALQTAVTLLGIFIAHQNRNNNRVPEVGRTQR